jgi:hypothetical protein
MVAHVTDHPLEQDHKLSTLSPKYCAREEMNAVTLH